MSMSSQAQGGPRWRNGPFQGRERDPDTPSPGPPPGHARSKSSIMQAPISPAGPLGHVRNQSVSDLRPSGLGRSDSRRNGSTRGGAFAGTFAPQFIKPENMNGTNGDVRVVEGENDLSGKRYIWMRDDEKAFVKGWVLEELPDGMLRAQCEDGSVSSELRTHTKWRADMQCSNETLQPTASTRSTRPSSTKQTTWPNSHI
jgi:myosin protein heavy chain